MATPGSGQIEVGWTPGPTGVATAYLVTYSPSAGGAPQTVTVASPATMTILTGLAVGTEYNITVAARDASNAVSPVSAAVKVTSSRPPTTAELAAYQSAAAYSDSQSGNAVVVMRNGSIVFERYASSLGQAGSNPLASGTKSFTCAFAVAAETDGLVAIDDFATVYLSEWSASPRKSLIRVRDLLSLQSGFTGDPTYSAFQVPSLDTYAQALNTNQATYDPGQAFVYDPLSFQAYALMFERRSAGEDPVAYLKRKVFDPIGLVVTSWTRDRLANPQMAGGASMTARDWLKYGQLSVQNGAWQGRQILDPQKFRRCFEFPNPAYGGYGLTWWLNRPVGDTLGPLDQVPEDGIAGPSGQIAPSAPADMAMAAGLGNQRLYVIPSAGLTVVRFAPLGAVVGSSAWSDETFLAKLLGKTP